MSDTSKYKVTQDTRFGDDVDNLDDLGAAGPDGVPLTEEGTERYTARRGGRPSLGRTRARGRGPSPRIAFRVPDDLFEQVREVAEREGTDVSKVARHALEEYLHRAS